MTTKAISPCYGTPMGPELLVIERSIALHTEVAARIRRDPTLLERAKRRVSQWLDEGSVANPYARAWAKILESPLEEVLHQLVERSEEAHDLRQVSPFAGVIDPRTRWRILKAVRVRLSS
jgi:hypothetical protein